MNWWRLRVVAGSLVILAAIWLSPWGIVSRVILFACYACAAVLLYRQLRERRARRSGGPPAAV